MTTILFQQFLRGALQDYSFKEKGKGFIVNDKQVENTKSRGAPEAARPGSELFVKELFRE